MNAKGKQLLRYIAEAFLVGILIFIMTITNLFSAFDYMLKDAAYQIPRGIDSKIKIIGIDDRTLEQLGPIQTWSRDVYARLLRQLVQEESCKPVVIGFDIIFSGEGRWVLSHSFVN